MVERKLGNQKKQKNSEASIKLQSISCKCSSIVVVKITWPVTNKRVIFMEKKQNRCIKCRAKTEKSSWTIVILTPVCSYTYKWIYAGYCNVYTQTTHDNTGTLNHPSLLSCRQNPYQSLTCSCSLTAILEIFAQKWSFLYNLKDYELRFRHKM